MGGIIEVLIEPEIKVVEVLEQGPPGIAPEELADIQAAIVNLQTAIQTKADAETVDAALSALEQAIAQRLTQQQGDDRYWPLTTDLATQQELGGAIAAEAADRQAVVAALAADLTTEISARQSADSGLDTRLDVVEAMLPDLALDADLATEISNRQAADTALGNRLTTVEADLPTRALATDLTTEATARAAADTALSNALAAETSARQSADTDLQDQLTAVIGGFTSGFADGVRGTILSGLSLLTGGAIAATDNLLAALGKIQNQISDNKDNISKKAEFGPYKGSSSTIYYTSPGVGAGVGNTNLSPNVLYLVPFLALKDHPVFNRIGVQAGSSIGGTVSVRLGVYDCDSSGLPSSLIASSSQMTTSSSAAILESVISVPLTPGAWYFLAFVSSASVNWRLNTQVWSVLPIHGGFINNANSLYSGFSRSFTYDVLPNTASVALSDLITGNTPRIHLRAV